jgi:glycosyltransferase involved in cell wall biosynthesis
MNDAARAPKVTFLVPCYKLAHLLGECVESILEQTYRDLEVLIMDDCSPDDTERVARSFADPRVRYVRNDPNLGHLRNYNKGIGLARGEYVWLISADDCLKQPYILERYMKVMERHPRVGYIFCPAVDLRHSVEQGVMQWTQYATRDAILPGRRFLRQIMNGNTVATPTAMVRKACYDTVSVFPLDLPHTGDWFLWCAFALHYDVAYLAEPMAYYRTHGENMSLALRRADGNVVRNNLRSARWKLRAHIAAAGDRAMLRHCDRMLADRYANEIARRLYDADPLGPTLEEFETSLREQVEQPSGQRRIRAHLHEALGDQAYQVRRIEDAKHHYDLSLRELPLQPRVRLKRRLLRMRRFGDFLRTAQRTIRGNRP